MGDTWDQIANQHAAGPGRGGTPTAAADVPTQPPPESALHYIGRHAVGLLPAAGATAAGIAASPGAVTAIPAAAAGAGAGEAARQAIVSWFPSLGQAPTDTAGTLTEIGKQMAFGGATEAAGPYINKLFATATPWLKASAKKSLLAVMNPVDKYSKGHALEAADQLLNGPGKAYMAGSRSGLEKRAGENIANVGAQIGAAEAPVAQNVIPPNLVQELNQSLDDYSQTMYMPQKNVPGASAPTVQPKYGNEPNIQALTNIRQHLENEMPGVNPATGAVEPGYGDLSRESLRLVRQNVDNAVRNSEGFARGAMQRGGAVEPALASKIKVEKDAGDIFRGILNKDQPDIAKLNAEYHLWSNVRDAMSPATLNKEFSKEASPWQELWHNRYAVWLAGAGSAAGVGGYVGGKAGAGEAALATGALFAVNQALKSGAWRTTSAAIKNELADMLAKGQLEGAAKLATRIGLQSNTTLPPPVQQAAKSATATVKMKAPDGSVQDVPKEQVDHYKALGATVAQ